MNRFTHALPLTRRQRAIQWLGPQHLLVAFGIPCLFLLMMAFGGSKSLDILIHTGQTTAVITGEEHALTGHEKISYRYEVDGLSYSGSSYYARNSTDAPGNVIEILYSSEHPAVSTACSPFIIFGKFFAGAIFLLLADNIAAHYAKRYED